MSNRDLREKRAKIILEAQAILKTENRSADDVARANKMLDDSDAIKSEYEAVERADALEAETRSFKEVAKPSVGVIDTPEARTAAQKESFRKYFVGDKSFNADDRKNLRTFNRNTGMVETRDMNGDTGPDGSYLVPVGYQKEIDIALKTWGQMLSICRTWTTDSGQPIQWPTSNDTNQYAVEMTDGTSVAESDIPLGQVTFNVSTFSSGLVKASRSLVQDSAFDLGAFIGDSFATRLARGLNKAVTNGSTSGNVGSIVTAATSGGTSAAPTAVSYLDLVQLYSSLEPAYIPNSTFCFNNQVFRQLLSLEDTLGRSIFLSSISQGAPDTILGRPYVINQDLPNPAATTKSILFGNFQKYVLRYAGGYELLKLVEYAAPAHQYAYILFSRHSGQLIDSGSHPILALVQHT